MGVDQFGVAVAGDPASVAAWNEAFGQLLAYRGDPLAALALANTGDDAFALGPAFSAAYRLLGGVAPDQPVVVADLVRMTARARTPREQAATEAVALMAEGQWSLAADRLDTHARTAPRDLFAIKLSHDLRLHCGGLARSAARTVEAVGGWQPGESGYGHCAGMVCFALEEAGEYAEAQRWGEVALAIEPGDAWARHAMAHVFESVGDNDAFTSVLTDAGVHWHDRPLFTNHLWWHDALRSWNRGEVERTFELADTQLVSTTAFGRCDTTALVWRADLAGLDMTARWAALAEAWSVTADVHHSAFVDLHAATVFATVPGEAADRFWHGLHERLAAAGHRENDRTFGEVVRPFAEVVRAWRGTGGRRLIPDAHEALADKLWHAGGSALQRQLFHDTLAAVGAAP